LLNFTDNLMPNKEIIFELLKNVHEL
jgi:hypothetical protein